MQGKYLVYVGGVTLGCFSRQTRTVTLGASLRLRAPSWSAHEKQQRWLLRFGWCSRGVAPSTPKAYSCTFMASARLTRRMRQMWMSATAA